MFHQDYKMTDPPSTTPAMLRRAAAMLRRAAAIGRTAGLRFVYAGNLASTLDHLEDTRCPDCDRTLIARRGFRVLRDDISPSGRCPACQTPIWGRWN